MDHRSFDRTRGRRYPRAWPGWESSRGSRPPPGEPTHQEILQSLATLQSTLSGIASNGVACKVRSYYLTTASHMGGEALTACAIGFHMASLWEIFDTSNLRYDTINGHTDADSGAGPPANAAGWVRTGYASTFTDEGPGLSNCAAWNKSDTDAFGTEARLIPEWNFDASRSGPWDARTRICFASRPVWCIAD